MDHRALFLFVFLFTLLSTVLVAAACYLTGQTLLDTTLYSLATMWLVGIVAQVLGQQLYLGIIRPLEESRLAKTLDKVKSEINIDEIEEIDQVAQLELAKQRAQKVEEEIR